MGFRYYGKGAFLSCWCDGDAICVRRTSGVIERFPTKLHTVIPEQCVTFIGNNVAFVLYADDVMYVGRNNGTITGYRGDLIVRYTSWQAPSYPNYHSVGHVFGDSIHELQLDSFDNRTLVLSSGNNEYLLDEKYQGVYVEYYSLSEALSHKGHVILVDTKGDIVYDPPGRWAVPLRPEWRSYQVTL